METDPFDTNRNLRIADPDSVRRIRFIDTLFAVAALAAILAGAMFGFRNMPSRQTLLCVAILATAFTAYKVLRMFLEYHAGVSVRFSRRGGGSDYYRATQPYAFWWAMGIEAAWLLIGASVAVLLWVALALS